MKKMFLLLMMLSVAVVTQAQMMDPVHFSATLHKTANAEAEIVFTGTIDAGWHVYSTDLGSNGPIEASFHVVKMTGAELLGPLTPRGEVIKKYDELFGMELQFFEHAATFVQKIKFTQPEYDIDCYLEYGACDDVSCLPPSQVDFREQGTSPVKAAEAPQQPRNEIAAPADDDTVTILASDRQLADASLSVSPFQSDLWQSSVNELRQLGSNDSVMNRSLFYILLMGFLGGLLAVCMPCIWPIIPMTVSFFLKRAKDDHQRGIKEAFTYGLSIIVIYLTLGLLVTAFFGSDQLNALSTHAIFNIFLFLLLVAFALSFFGWFEIKLPDSWANSIDTKASRTSGLVSIFLMAFTLVLVSFSCTAPIVGLLLVETATNGNWLAPALGMFGFSVALALPFTLFALFPTWLKQAPKSGAWMNTLKVTLGFIELAFALKFFSVADLAYGWHLLDREVFLALWIAIFALLGAYLIGWFRFQSDHIDGILDKPMPVISIMGGMLSMAFAIYMVPGLWGAPCKAISAFAPPMSTQDFRLNDHGVVAAYTDYEAGMAAAKAQGKPVLIDFTGFGCVNCRKMEAAVWTDPRVAHKLTNDFVLISLYVDDKTALPAPIEVTDEQGHTRILRTIGAKWSYLQSHKFGANAQPFYVMLDAEGHPLAGSRSYDEDVSTYIDFLNAGLEAYNHR